MKVAISGSSGLVGSALVEALQARGHQVIHLVRKSPEEIDEHENPGRTEASWLPDVGLPRPTDLEGIDALVHLAGENIAGGRWSEQRKRRIHESRGPATRRLIDSLRSNERPPRALICASAIGWYGAHPGEAHTGAEPTGDPASASMVTEASAPGDDFLARVCLDWEDAAREASSLCERVVMTRFGVILSPDGGALAKMLPAFRLGLGGPLGTGQQHMSVDRTRRRGRSTPTSARRRGTSGAVQPHRPHPVTQREFAKTLGAVISRPAILPAPKLALELLLGEMAEQTLLADQRVAPVRLVGSGFEHRWPELGPALRHLLAD